MKEHGLREILRNLWGQYLGIIWVWVSAWNDLGFARKVFSKERMISWLGSIETQMDPRRITKIPTEGVNQNRPLP